MTEIDPQGLLRAELATLREELSRSVKLLRQMTERCQSADVVIDVMAEHITYLIEAAGGSIVITEAQRLMARDRVVQGYHVETLEDDRQRFYTLTPEEYEEANRKQTAVDDAREQGGGLRIIEP